MCEVRRYLVKIKPLEQYSFGNDQNFKYPGEKETGKESYYLRSKEMPEQTTVLGLIRYLILQKSGLLKTNFDYTQEERNHMEECIGKRSFSYLQAEPQDFGYIQEISPVFILNEKEEVLVKNPYHNKETKTGYAPINMMETKIETSQGDISLPELKEYDAKKGHAFGYINLSTKEIESDVFESKVISGNKKKEGSDLNKDGFFKREVKCLKDGYSFGVYVDVCKKADMTVLPEKTIGYMGKKKSAFLIETHEVIGESLEDKVTKCFIDADGKWYYALSDLVLTKVPVYDSFCIVEEKYQRNLETIYDEKGTMSEIRKGKTRKSEIRHHLIQSGSVFYETCSLDLKNENCQKIGYNKVVKLGGN